MTNALCASFIISDKSDFFQNAKFCPVLNIYNSADDQFFKFAWVANSMLTCTVSYVVYTFLRPLTRIQTHTQTQTKKIWKVLGSATEWVGRGSIGWAGAVSGGQGQYRLFHYPSQIFSISKKFFKMLFRLVGPKKLI